MIFIREWERKGPYEEKEYVINRSTVLFKN